MPSIVIEGAQWGDEGKGKITDYLALHSDVVVRYQGGNNAGHTVSFNGETYAIKSLPSGIFNPNIINIIADGVVVNPFFLKDEIEGIKARNIKDFKLYISNRAHLIMPYHLDLDGAYEAYLKDDKIGTTKKGIGPAYIDKMARRGIRMGDLLNEQNLRKVLQNALIIKNIELKSLNLKPYDFDDLLNQLLEIGEYLKPYICDTADLINDLYDQNKMILFEGAQGMMLDIDRGTYPYVTSSSPTSNYASQGSGLSPKKIDSIVAICKAYTTRVGEGPFPSELHNKLGDYIREKGHEYGTVTKRPRRVGYLDLVVLKRNLRQSGATSIALTLFDVLSDIDELKVCVGYKLDGKEINTIPSTIYDYDRCEPIYVDMSSFHISEGTTKYEELSIEAKKYIEFIEQFTGVKVSILSVGKDRNATIRLGSF